MASTFIGRNSNYSDISHTHMYIHISYGKCHNDPAAEEAFVIFRISCAKYHYVTDVARSYIHSPKLSSAVDHAGDRRIHVPPRAIAYKSDMQRARDTATTSRLIIEKRTTRRARPENCGPSSRLLHTRLFAERAGTREGNKERALQKSSFRERLSRQVSRSALRAAPRA